MPITIADGCSNDNECVSRCVNEADCAALAFVIAEPPADPNRIVPAGAGTLSECVTDCAERSRR